MKDEDVLALLSNLHPSSFILHPSFNLSLPFGSLLSVFGFLAGTATAVGSGDVAFFLGFCPHLALAVILALVTATTTAPDDAALDDGVDIHSVVHGCWYQ